MLGFDENGNLSKSVKNMRQKKTPSIKKEMDKKSEQTSNITSIIAKMTDAARAHLLGSCYKIFKYYNNNNKIHVSLRNDDNFKIINLTENVLAGKEIIITRDDINSIFEEVSKPNISKVITKIRGSKLSGSRLGKGEYYFKTTDTTNERPVTRGDVSVTGEFEKSVSRNRNNVANITKNKVGEKEINQLVLEVPQDSSGFKRANRLKLYSKPVTNKYVINSSASTCLKIKGHEIYLFVIQSSGDNVGVAIMEESERNGIDPLNSPAFISMLISSLASPKLTA